MTFVITKQFLIYLDHDMKGVRQLFKHCKYKKKKKWSIKIFLAHE